MKMNSTHTSFDLFLQSNASMNMYPSNVISSFTNNFNGNIQLRGEWKVALRTVGYKKTWLNITNRDGVQIVIATHEVRKENRQVHLITRRIPPGSYVTPSAFIRMFYGITKTLYTNSDNNNEDVRNIYALEDVLKIEYRNEINRFTFEIITNMFKKIVITIEPSLAGLQLRKVIGVGPMDTTKPANIIVRRTKIYTAAFRADFCDKVNNFWIHAPGLIEMCQVGNSMKPLLTSIPIQQGEQGEYIHYTVDNPMYVRVTNNTITDISIDVLDEFNKRIAFDDNSAPFVLSLHFIQLESELQSVQNSAIPWGLSSDEMYVYMFSTPTDKFKYNTATDFHNHLAKPMFLSGNWVVALCELRYQKSWVQLYRSQEVSVYLNSGGCCLPRYISVKFKRGNYFTPHDLTRVWNETWVMLFVNNENVVNEENEDDESPSADPTSNNKIFVRLGRLVRLIYSPANRRFIFTIVKNDRVQIRRAIINFSPSINRESHQDDADHYRDDLIYLFGVQIYDTEDNNKLAELIKLDVFDSPHLLASAPDFQDQTYNLWVTAPNLVEMTRIADTVQPLLNVVPVKGRTNDYLHHVYTERHYVRTKAGNYNDIHIRIVDGVHEVVELRSTKPTIALLHFKRVV